jgi:hypothetical protein
MSGRQRALIALGLGISAVFLWFAFRDLKPGTVLDAIANANAAWLLAGAVWYFAAVAIITLRWQFLLRAVQFVPIRALYPLVCIGYMGNNVYPFRSGEALRVYLLRRNHGVRMMRGLTTVLVERVFDGLVMLTFIVVPLLFLDITSDDVRRVATFAAPVFLTALAAFFVLAARPDLLRWLVRRFSMLLPGKLSELIGRLSEEVIVGLEGLRTPLHLAGTIATSYLTWALEASVYWMVAAAFDLDAGYGVMLLVVGTVNLAGLIPASPGQIGVFEFFASAVLVAAGIDEALALSYALTVHLVIWLPVTLAGFAFLTRQGMSWRDIAQAREEVDTVS